MHGWQAACVGVNKGLSGKIESDTFYIFLDKMQMLLGSGSA